MPVVRIPCALVQKRMFRAAVSVEGRVVPGPPADALIQQARDANLLVVGTRGLGGFRELILGSVSDQVARHSPCPVVIMPSPKS